MPATLRTGLFLAFIGLALAGTVYTNLDQLAGLKPYPQNLSEADEDLRRELKRADVLEAERQKVAAHLTAKIQVATDLAAGRLTLVEATVRVRDLKDKPGYFWRSIRQYEAGSSEEERLCRHVIGWTEAMLCNQPARAARVNARLKKELEEQLARHGKVTLPR
jgi:hypothetical protein